MVSIVCDYQGALRCSAEHGPSGSRLETDAPLDNQGKGERFSPTDLVATALASCILTVMGITAERHGWSLEGCTARVEKSMTTSGRRKIAKLEVWIQLPQALDEKARAVLQRVAEGCPVKESLEGAVAMELHWKLRDRWHGDRLLGWGLPLGQSVGCRPAPLRPPLAMANIDHAPSRTMLNLLHVLPAFADEGELRLNAIVELNSNTINKYELITETGHLKLDRVGYSSLAYPFAYGCIPRTWDEDGDPLDIEIVGVTEPLVPGSLVEARIIGIMTFDDGGEVDDKVIAVLADDKRMDHITSFEQLGAHWKTETQYYWEHYKDLKKPGTCKVNGFLDVASAVKIIKECEQRYLDTIDAKLVN